jgi:hypothetical protein
VWMLEPGGELDLPLEPLGAYARSHFGRQDLDDDRSAQADLLGEEDAAHPPTAQLALDLVGIADSRLKPGLELDINPLRGLAQPM